MNIVNRIKERSELAEAYAGDGALHSAARILRELSDEVSAQAALADRFLASMMGGSAAPNTDDEARS